MHFIFLDAESYWDQEYTLKKLSPGEYITDERFELQSMSIRIDPSRNVRGITNVYFGEAAIRAALDAANIEDAMVIGHNMSGFDALIFTWKLGYNPKLFCCTLAMARAVVGHETSLGLGALVKFFKIGVKNDAILHATRGRRLAQFTPDELQSMTTYNGEDTDQCSDIFYRLLPYFTAAELWHIDCTIRARVFPELRVNEKLLLTALAKEKESKREDLLELAEAIGVERGITDDHTFEAIRARLASAPKFVSLLEDLGVEVPYKPSPKNPKKLIPALAKTDEGFLELLDSDDELVASAAAARLSIKSTLLETRITKIVTASRHSPNGALPAPYKYGGAKVTLRWSGEEYNLQNLPRIDAADPKNSDALRQCIEAPEGFVIGQADQSGIELRINHHLWQCRRSMQLYKLSAVADLYRDFSSNLYLCTPEAVTKPQRQVGKVAHLGLGFGAGPTTFMRVARIQGKIKMELPQATQVTYAWRDTYHEIPEGWRLCQEAIPYMAEGTERGIDPGGLCHTVKDGIVLPTGHIIRYPGLRQCLMEDPTTHKDKWEWIYGYGRFVRRLYGPKMTENMVQAMARDTVAEDALEFFKQTGYRWKTMTHDELVYLWREAEAQGLLAILQAQMRKPRTWWPELVLWSEGGIGHTYAEAH